MANKNFLDNNGLLYLWQKIKTLLSGKVDKVDGKGLSTNDFTDSYKRKIDGLQSDGYMMKTTYDSDGNGVVDNAEKLGGQLPSYYAKQSELNDAFGGITQLDSTKANASDVYNKEETDNMLSACALKSDLTTVYRYAGTKSTIDDPTGYESGAVYNMTVEFTTTADFVEGAGITYPAGTNIVKLLTWSQDEAGLPIELHQWEVLSGTIDLSPYQKKSELTAITNNEIDTILSS
jgi:hypothetical protein